MNTSEQIDLSDIKISWLYLLALLDEYDCHLDDMYLRRVNWNSDKPYTCTLNLRFEKKSVRLSVDGKSLHDAVNELIKQIETLPVFTVLSKIPTNKMTSIC